MGSGARPLEDSTFEPEFAFAVPALSGEGDEVSATRGCGDFELTGFAVLWDMTITHEGLHFAADHGSNRHA